MGEDAKFAKEGVKVLPGGKAAGDWPRPKAAVCSTIEVPPRRVLQEHLDSPTGRAWGEMLRMHAEWLSGWHASLQDIDGDGQPVRVGMDDYWVTESWGADGRCDPHLIMDVVHDEEERLVMLQCSPYHDEGGPSILTAWLEWDEGPFEKPGWSLRGMVQEFDLQHDLVVRDGQLVKGWEGGA